MPVSFTPIGPVRVEYPHFKLLCQMAHLSRRVERRRVGEQDVQNEVWSIRTDPELVPATSYNTTGKAVKNPKDMRVACGRHYRFQMLLDLIRWKGNGEVIRQGMQGSLDWENVLDVALGKAPDILLPDGSKLRFDLARHETMPWRELNNLLVASGVHGYSSLPVESSQPQKPEKNKPAGWTPVQEFLPNKAL